MVVFWFIVGSLLSLNLLWAWHADVVLRRAGHGWRLRIWPPAFALAMGGALTAFILGRGSEDSVRSALPIAFVAALYLWHLVVLPVWLALAPPVEFFRFLGAGWRYLRKSDVRRREGRAGDETREVGGEAEAVGSSREDAAPRASAGVLWGEPSRRRFLVAAAAAPPVLLAGATGVSLRQVERFRVREIEIPLAALPPALDGLTIAHLSDLHVGVFTSGGVLDELATATNALQADLVALTGDIINDDLADLPEAIAMILRLRARHGVFLCEGNHDLIPGPHGFGRGVREAGLRLLVNEAADLNIKGVPVQVLGLRWGSGRPRADRAEDYGHGAIEHSVAELAAQRDPAAFPVLLAHHPHAFDPAAAAGFPLTLSGHTHGGQIMLTEALGFGPALFRYWSGLYQVADDGEARSAREGDRASGAALVVSNGAGNWFPLRTAAPAEILRLTLRSAG